MTEPATLAREIVAGCDHVGFRSDQDYWHAAYEKPGACEDCIAAALRAPSAPPAAGEREAVKGETTHGLAGEHDVSEVRRVEVVSAARESQALQDALTALKTTREWYEKMRARAETAETALAALRAPAPPPEGPDVERVVTAAFYEGVQAAAYWFADRRPEAAKELRELIACKAWGDRRTPPAAPGPGR